MNLLLHARISKATTNTTKMANNNCGGIRGNLKKDLVWQRGTHMSEVSKLPTGVRMRAA
jgi:hypothetical protein